MVVVVVAVETPLALKLAAAVQVASVAVGLPLILQLSATDAVWPEISVSVSRANVDGPSVTVIVVDVDWLRY